ncbi:MAG: sulfatase-like hydrolase/transferase [Fimbriimonadaceae bacterium]
MNLASLVCALAVVPQSPDVVLVLIDDMGWQDTSLSFGLTEKLVGRHLRTPNLEALAKRGTTVNQAYSSCTVCTPTRVSLLTGVNPARSHITSWVHSNNDTDPGHPELATPDWNKAGLQPGDTTTLAQEFALAGYRTVQIGKAHFGSAGTLGADPRNLGFETVIAGSAAGHPSSYYGLENFARKKNDPSQPPAHNDVPGLEAYHGKDVYLEDALAQEAAQVVRETAASGKPLFLWYSPYAVHTPIQPNRRLLGHYEGLDPTETAYATMVETVDEALGTIVTALRETGRLAKTVIVFTSDNGGLSQTSRGGYPNLHNLPLRSGKGSAYEGGTRVPFVAAGPGIAAGRELERTWLVSVDLFTTLAELSGLKVEPKDGVSMAKALGGGADATRSAANVWHYPHHRGFGGPGLEPYSAIRDGAFKSIYFYGQERWELYNVVNDPGETRDVSRSQTERLASMAKALVESLEAMGAQYPRKRATGEALPPKVPNAVP